MATIPLVTLTTDFGTRDSYVAQMKGVMYSICRELTIVDLCHDVPPQDIAHASRLIAEACPRFPAGTIHVIVVDPGVGTNRRLLLATLTNQHFICPDNGLLTQLVQATSTPIFRTLKTDHPRFGESSRTFQGRDVMGPAAAYLASGVPWDELAVASDQWVALPEPPCRTVPNGCEGQIVGHDAFGNLLTNLRRCDLDGRREGAKPVVFIGEVCVNCWIETYGEADAGKVVALIGSSDRLEVAMVNGNAANALQIPRGTKVRVQW